MEMNRFSNIANGRGGKLLYVQCPELKVSIVSVWFRAGSCFDPMGKEGLAHFFEHLLLQKTKRDTSCEARHRRLEAFGIDFFAYTQKETAYFYHIQSPEKTTESLLLLAEGITDFDFSNNDLERERNVILSEKSAYDRNPSDHVWDLIFNGLFHDSSFDHNPFGTTETLESITAADVKNFYSERYSLSSAVWVILSPLADSSLLESELEKCVVSHLRDDNAVKERSKSLGKVLEKQKEEMNNDDAALVAIAFRTPDIFHIESIVRVDLLRFILASGWISLFNKTLRLEKGLIYWAKSAFSQFRDRGYVAFFFDTQKKFSKQVEGIALEQIELMKDITFIKESISMHRAAFTTQFLRTYHNPEDLLWWYGYPAFHGLIQTTPEIYLQHLMSITPQQLTEEAEKIFSKENRTIIHLG